MSTPVLAANLKWLFSEWPLAERFAMAAACGFRAVELSLPYDLPLERLRSLLDAHGLRFVYLLAAPGDWDSGARGLACVPGSQREFRAGVDQAIAYARGLDRPLVHAAAGIMPEGSDPAECLQVLHANLRWACAQAAAHGLRVVIEPVCRRDYPRFIVNTVGDALRTIAEVGAGNLGIVLDLHQVQWEEGADAGSVHAALRAALPRLWHVQLALAPDRNAPGESAYDIHGTIDEALRLGYEGVFSCEYRPAAGTLPSLAWAARYGIHAPARTAAAAQEAR